MRRRQVVSRRFALTGPYMDASAPTGGFARLALAATGVAFPFFSAVVGWLGVFLTGSDTSANALFGNLQVVTANALHLNPVLTASVNDIEHIESQSLYGISVIKIFLQKDAKVEAATAQVTAISQSAIRQMPPGTNPPLIIRYSASNVPILQLSVGSATLNAEFTASIGVSPATRWLPSASV